MIRGRRVEDHWSRRTGTNHKESFLRKANARTANQMKNFPSYNIYHEEIFGITGMCPPWILEFCRTPVSNLTTGLALSYHDSTLQSSDNCAGYPSHLPLIGIPIPDTWPLTRAKICCFKSNFVVSDQKQPRSMQHTASIKVYVYRWEGQTFDFITKLIPPLFVLSVLVIRVRVVGPKVREFKPGRGWWIFKGDKSLQHALLRRESKAVGSMS
jgi:hypothetical protein